MFVLCHEIVAKQSVHRIPKNNPHVMRSQHQKVGHFLVVIREVILAGHGAGLIRYRRILPATCNERELLP